MTTRLKEGSYEVDTIPARDRILDAAFSAFIENGYAQTSTLEIATRAHVSKRALYELVGNKQEMLIACISKRAKRLQVPADLPEPRDREGLEHALAAFGAQLLREVSDPTVMGVFQLAIAEVGRAPEIASALNSIAHETFRTAMKQIIARAKSFNLLSGSTDEMIERFTGLLWGNLMLLLLLRVADRPTAREITRRSRAAAIAFLQLYPQPEH